jgi:hypothetical protein
MEQAGFPFVEAFGVERIGELVELIVQVVAKLVQKGAKE